MGSSPQSRKDKMKKWISGILIFTGFFAEANFLGTRYSNDQLRFESRCGIPVCRANDNGHNFIKYCAFQHGSNIPSSDLPVYVWHGQSLRCYCPCDYDFENQVSQSR